MKKKKETTKKPRVKKQGSPLVHSLVVPYYIVLVLLVIVPIFIMILASFQEKSNSIFTVQFTLENYANFFKVGNFLKTMGQSLYFALITTVITLIIGYPLAYFIAQTKPRTQGILILLISVPMWVNMLLRVKAIQQTIDIIMPGVLGSNLAIIIGLVHVFLPFMVIPIYTVLIKIDKSLYEASSDLGANKFKTFYKVVLPLSMSGVMSGIMMVFLPAATTLVVPKYLGNNRKLIGNLIELKVIQEGNFGEGSAIAIILSIIIMIMIFLIKKFDRYKEAGNEN